MPFMALLAGCATPASKPQIAPAAAVAADSFGVLVMAHGGGKQWNQDVLASLQPLKDEYNLEVAFGMADAASLQQGVQQLESRGARQIGVVRLFISGESFKERTEQILGVIPGAPVKPAATNDMRVTKATAWSSGKSPRNPRSCSASRDWWKRRKWVKCWPGELWH